MTTTRATPTGAPNIRGLPYSVDDSCVAAKIEVSNAVRGLAVNVSAILNDSDQGQPGIPRVRLELFADGMREANSVYSLHNEGVACSVGVDAVEALGLALLTLAKSLQRSGVDVGGVE